MTTLRTLNLRLVGRNPGKDSSATKIPYLVIIMSQFNIHTAKAHLSELIQRALLGEEVIIARDNKPIAKLVVLQPVKHKRRLGTAKGLFKMANDFNEPLSDFDEYVK